jgi:hypothetical protein
MVGGVDSEGTGWEKSSSACFTHIYSMNRATIILLLSLSAFLMGCATPDVKFSDLSTTTATISSNEVTVHLGSDMLNSACWTRPKAKVEDQTVYVVGYRTLRERSREFVVKLPASVDSQSVSVIWVDPDGSHAPVPVTK